MKLGEQNRIEIVLPQLLIILWTYLEETWWCKGRVLDGLGTDGWQNDLISDSLDNGPTDG